MKELNKTLQQLQELINKAICLSNAATLTYEEKELILECLEKSLPNESLEKRKKIKHLYNKIFFVF